MRTLDRTDRRELRVVRIGDGEPDMSLFPDFFVLGPERTGSKRLAQMLGWHPEICVTEPAELHYFNRLHMDGRLDHEWWVPEGWQNDLAWYVSSVRAGRRSAAMVVPEVQEQLRRQVDCSAGGPIQH